MLAFIIRRLLQSVVVMLTVSLIAFTLFRFVGDPINQMVGIETTAEERAQLRQDLVRVLHEVLRKLQDFLRFLGKLQDVLRCIDAHVIRTPCSAMGALFRSGGGTADFECWRWGTPERRRPAPVRGGPVRPVVER